MNKKNSSTLQNIKNKKSIELLNDCKKLLNTLSKNKSVFKTPCYFYDSIGVTKSVNRFVQAFQKVNLQPEIYFAIKSNPFNLLIKDLTKLGIGIDVSSIQELDVAKKSGAKRIIVTGPGKDIDSIRVFLKEPKIKKIYLDSLHEVKIVSELVKKYGVKILNNKNIGIRILPESLSSWDKFGVHVDSVAKLLNTNQLGFNITALQFHISYVKSGEVFSKALKEVNNAFKKVPSDILDKIKYIDIGGGYTPESLEGEYLWNMEGLSLFDIVPIREKILSMPAKKRASFPKVSSIEEIAKEISAAWNKFIKPLFRNATINLEPGRYFSANSMHILLKVADLKSDKSIILNGGWNMLGWEKYQYIFYAPVFNLSRLNFKNEFPVVMYGNLCLPDDIWGYYLHGDSVEIGDTLLIPYQGAYTYTYRQSFIRGIPKVYKCR